MLPSCALKGSGLAVCHEPSDLYAPKSCQTESAATIVPFRTTGTEVTSARYVEPSAKVIAIRSPWPTTSPRSARAVREVALADGPLLDQVLALDPDDRPGKEARGSGVHGPHAPAREEEDRGLGNGRQLRRDGLIRK